MSVADAVVFDSNANRIAIVYRALTADGVATRVAAAAVGTLDISFGVPTTVFFETYGGSPSSRDALAVFDSNVNKVVLAYGGSGNLNIALAEISGTTVTVSTSPTNYASGTNISFLVFDSNEDAVVAGFGNTARVFSPDLREKANEWIGVSVSALSNGQTGPVTAAGGVNGSQAGLTAGLVYYLQPDGSIATGGVFEREIGRALSATELLITTGSVN